MADPRTPAQRIGRLALAAVPPLAGAACLYAAVGLLALQGLCFYGECGPNLLGWAVPLTASWLAGSVAWASGVRRRLPARMRAGAVLLLAVPLGGWAILELVVRG